MAPRQLDVLAGSNVVKYVSLAAQKTQFLVKKITRTTVSMPINWGGPIGDMVATDFKHAAYNMEDAVYKPLGVEREDFKGYIDKMFEEAKENKTFANTHGVSFQVEKS
ncbi:hypothetical protein HK100_004197 [Physocladia obscura]|uniref:Uncharacterized protein n=1 Tax=Physocladia obscura TaxID=109957 RepID=A0AAD5X8X3_9FUNG|nr:hypothetical protein HK100_004197 [Physocladia obscura]